MSLRFSRVVLSAEGRTTSFLTGGIPHKTDDLLGWISFQKFMNEIPASAEVTAHIESFLYGGEEPFDATPEEVAYFYQRIRLRPNFIEKRTEKCGESDMIIQTRFKPHREQ